jgi:4-oxalocrotonate tautomerase
MPFIVLKLIGKLTREQKETIAKEFSDTLLKVANKPKDATHLIIEEMDGSNCAHGDKLLG